MNEPDNNGFTLVKSSFEIRTIDTPERGIEHHLAIPNFDLITSFGLDEIALRLNSKA